jgi:fibronectin-binding autotransporter adhesin
MRAYSALGCFIVLLVQNSHAAAVTKAATGTELADGASWDGRAPGPDDVATWASGSLGADLTLQTSASWRGISLPDAMSDVVITGAGTLTLGAGGIDLSSAARNLSISNPLTLGTSHSWSVAGGRSLTLGGRLAGPGGFTLMGPGTAELTLAGAGNDSYAGATTIDSGTLTLKRFPPAAPPPGAVLWLDAADSSTLFADNAAAQPVAASGDTVARWNDKSGNNNHATLTGSQTAPTYQAGVTNGLSCVRFSSLTTCGMTTPLAISNGSFSVFIAASYNSTNVQFRRAIQGSDNWLIGPYNNQWQFFNGGFFAGVVSVPTRFFLMESIGNATQAGYVDGVYKASRTGSYPGTIHLAAVSPAAGPPYAEPLDGDIAEVLIYTNAMTAADRIAVESYLKTKWGLAFPTPADSPLPPTTPVSLACASAVLDLTNLTSCTIGSLSGAAGSQVQLGNAMLTVSNASSVAFGGNITGAGSLTKTGAGTLALSGTNSYAGSTTVNAGTLQLEAGASTGGGTFEIASAAGQTGTVSLAGGTITLSQTGTYQALGRSGQAVWNQTGGTASFSEQVNVADGASSSASLTFSGGTFSCGASANLGFILGTYGTATMSISGTADIRVPQTMLGFYPGGAGTLNMSGGTFTSTNASYSSIGLAGSGLWNQTGGTAVFASQLNIANGSNSISSMTISGGSLTVAAGTFYLGVSGSGTLSLGGGTGMASASFPTMSLGLNGGGAGVLYLLTNGLLTVGAGGIASGSGSATMNLGGGTLASPSTISWATALSATLTGIDGPLHVRSGNMITWRGVLSGSGGLVLDSGILYLDGTNTYGGATAADAGYLVARSPGAIGNTPSVNVAGGATFQLEGGVMLANTGTVYVAGAGPDGRGAISGWSGNNAMSNPVVLDDNATIAAQAGALTLRGIISGAAALTVGASGNGAATVVFSQPSSNTYDGDTTVAAGMLALGASDLIPDGVGKGSLIVSGTLSLNGNSETVNGLNGNGVVTGGGRLCVGAGGATSTFGGRITSDLSLTKIGAGSLTLNGHNDCSGSTAISQGTLVVNGSNASPVSVDGGTLAGAGTISGLVTVNGGGRLAPGSPASTLTLTGGLTLNDGAVLDVTDGNPTNLLRIAGGAFRGSGTGGTTVQVALTDPRRRGTMILADWTGATSFGVDPGDFVLHMPPVYDGRANLYVRGERLELLLYSGCILIVR